MKKEEIIAIRAKADKATKLEGEIERIKKQLGSLENTIELKINFDKSVMEANWSIAKSHSPELVGAIVGDIRIHLESKLAEKEKELEDL